MSTKVYVKWPVSARKTSIEQGGPDHGKYSEIDLDDASDKDRAVIARALQEPSNQYNRFTWPAYVLGSNRFVIDATSLSITEITIEALAKELSIREDKRAEVEKRDAEREAEQVKKTAARVKTWQTGEITATQLGCINWSSLGEDYIGIRAECDRAFDKERSAQKAEAKQKEEQLAKEKEQQKKQKREEREHWIREHGSERLRLALKCNIECGGIYRDERDAHEHSGWNRKTNELVNENFELGSLDDPRNPPLAVLRVLINAQKHWPETCLYYSKLWLQDADDPNANEYGDVRRGGIYLLSRKAWDGGKIYQFTPDITTTDTLPLSQG